MSSSVEVESTAVDSLPLDHERIPGLEVLIKLPEGLSDRFRKKLIRTANHTKGICYAVLNSADDMICHMDQEGAKKNSSRIIGRLKSRLESKITRGLSESERAIRSSRRSSDHMDDVRDLSQRGHRQDEALATA